MKVAKRARKIPQPETLPPWFSLEKRSMRTPIKPSSTPKTLVRVMGSLRKMAARIIAIMGPMVATSDWLMGVVMEMAKAKPP